MENLRYAACKIESRKCTRPVIGLRVPPRPLLPIRRATACYSHRDSPFAQRFRASNCGSAVRSGPVRHRVRAERLDAQSKVRGGAGRRRKRRADEDAVRRGSARAPEARARRRPARRAARYPMPRPSRRAAARGCGRGRCAASARDRVQHTNTNRQVRVCVRSGAASSRVRADGRRLSPLRAMGLAVARRWAEVSWSH